MGLTLCDIKGINSEDLRKIFEVKGENLKVLKIALKLELSIGLLLKEYCSCLETITLRFHDHCLNQISSLTDFLSCLNKSRKIIKVDIRTEDSTYNKVRLN